MIGVIKKKVKKAHKQSKVFRTALREQAFQYILAAFGLVAGLAWNDAIKALIEAIFPLQKNTVAAKFIYAILITGIMVFIANHLIKIFKENREKR